MAPTNGICRRTSCLGILVTAFLVMGAAGCGNNLQPTVQTALAETYEPTDPLQNGYNNGVDPITGDTQTNVTNYACPTSKNVTPDYDWQMNGTGYYTVCPARANTAGILVHGTPVDKSAIMCIFPAAASDPSTITVPRDSSTGLPVFQCVQASSSGSYATFASTISYNAVFIVDEEDVTSMQSCLSLADYYLCPKNYSFGLFRNYTGT